jgi:ABC-type microcin C transport system permease subunit YejE
LDIRCLILINDDNKYTPIWMSYHYIEIGGVFYKVTDELRNWIRNAFR